MRICTRLLLGAAFSMVTAAGWAEGPGVHTERDGKTLVLPEGEDSFHFVIFGDRTGGPAEGIEVLAEAVEDTNLLDPDLVMTVGDLINGYNEAPEWMEQMEEFQATMAGLEMPWFPVAGNHDVYWRGKDGADRPALEHEGLYEKHFGPLWYWFAHKDRGFLVLYTDESGNPEKPKSYSDPEQIQMSAEQLEWLSASLDEMRGLRQVFVFLHHPRWLGQYRESNWDEVHGRLAAAGNVRAVFAGHIHRLNYGGERDGIEYFALATTGGSMPGHMPELGYVHHLNMVTVREDEVTVAIVPVGEVLDPRRFSEERLGELDALRRAPLTSVYGPVRLDEEGAVNAEVALRYENPTSQRAEVTLTADPRQGRWRLAPTHRHLTLEPGEGKAVTFRLQRGADEWEEDFRAPRLQVDVDYLEKGGRRVSLPTRTESVPVTLSGALPAEVFGVEENGVLRLTGEGAVAVKGMELPGDEGITVEGWIEVERPSEAQAVLAKTENSEFGLSLREGRLRFDVHVGGKYRSVESAEALPSKRWVHVAAVHDLEAMRVYVDGRLAAEPVSAEGTRAVNGLPFYVGADPDGRGNPNRFFRGRVDELRISRGARYEGERIALSHRFEPDEDTAVLLHFDRQVGIFHPDHGPGGVHGMNVGQGLEIDEGTLPVLDTD